MIDWSDVFFVFLSYRSRVVTSNPNPEVGALAVLVPAEAGVISEGHKTISSILFCHSTGSAALIGGLQ